MSQGSTIQLVGPGMSGRGVRICLVSWTKQQAIEKVCAATITPDSKLVEYQAQIQRYGLFAMIVAVTEPCKAGEHVAGPWKPMSAQVLEESWDDIFTPRDTFTLRAMYDRMHTVTSAEVDAIMGKSIAFTD